MAAQAKIQEDIKKMKHKSRVCRYWISWNETYSYRKVVLILSLITGRYPAKSTSRVDKPPVTAPVKLLISNFTANYF